MSGKVFSVTPLLSRVLSLWAELSARIFARLHGVVEMGRFDQVDAVEYLINLQWRRESL